MSAAAGTDRGRLVTSPVGIGALLAVTMAVASMMVPLLSVLSGPIIEELDLSRSQFGWLLTASAAAAAVVAPSAGRLTDAWGGRFVLRCLFGLATVVLLALSVTHAYALVLLLSVVGGLPNGAGNPATNKLVMRYATPAARGTTIGVKQSGVQLGFLIAGAALPVLSATVGWRAAVAVAAAVPLTGLLASSRLPVDRPERLPDVAAPRRGPVSEEVRWVTAYSFLMGIVNAAVLSFLPLYGREAFGMGLAQAGGLVSLLGLVGIVGRIAAARHVGRTHRYAQALAAAAVVSAGSVLALLLAPVVGVWLLWVGVVVAGCSVAAWNALAHLSAVSITPAEDAGRASGSVAFGFLVGFGVGPVLLGYTADLTGSYVLGWATVAVMCLLALLTLRPLWRSALTNGGLHAAAGG